MPLEIKNVTIKVKNPTTQEFEDFGLIGSEALSSINSAKTDALAAITAATPPDSTVLTAIKNDIANNFNASTNYSVGDYVFYNNNLYKCLTAGTNAWNNNNWEQVQIVEEIDNLKNSITTTYRTAAQQDVIDATYRTAAQQDAIDATFFTTVDATLEQEGQPADAAATGNAIATLQESLSTALQASDLAPYRTATAQDVIDATFFSTTDTTLSVSGKPADAKVIGDVISSSGWDSAVAVANITNGEYFISGNSLYVATAAITQGETITPGTNCTKTDIVEVLNALRVAINV